MNGNELSIYIQFGSLLYIATVLFIFLTKKKTRTLENHYFNVISFENMTGLIMILAYCYITANYSLELSIASLLFKFILAYVTIWILTFTKYVYVISKEIKYEDEKENPKKWKAKLKFNKIILILEIIATLIILVLPLDMLVSGIDIYANPISLSYIFTFVVCISCVIYWFKLISDNNDKKFTKKYYPIIAFFILVIALGFAQVLIPQLAITVPVETLVTILIYFTMENPDIKLVEYEKTENERAIKANQAKTKFLDDMSKELRTPLYSIIGMSEDLETYKDIKNKEILEDIKDISNAASTLFEIVGNIIDINKIEGGKFDIVCSNYVPKEEFETLAKIMRTKIAEKPLEFTINISDKIPKVLYGDRVRIKQIINNLLSNAIKYTEKGNVDFTVNWYDASRSLYIKVSDTGIGVKPEDKERLFAKYDRLSVEKVSTVQGTGLGLAITKEIIEKMNGTIEVNSTYGKGTEFIVIIPQQIGNEDAIISENEYSLKSTKSIDLKGKKVLIVDDNLLNIKTFKKGLKELNLNIEECYNGQEALERIEMYSYDIIFSDIMMPNMDGIELIQILKNNPNFNTPIVALTADAMNGAREKYLSLGFDEYISKPFSKDTAINTTIKLLKK